VEIVVAKRNLADLIQSEGAALNDSDSTSNSSESSSIKQLEADIIHRKQTAIDEADKQILEQQIEALTQKLTALSGEHIVDLKRLEPDPSQPRTIFPKQLIQERTESLRRNGQISPIILIPLADGQYRIFDGAVRSLSAPHADLTSLRAVFLPYHDSLDDATRFEKQFVTGKDAEKLHDLDVANGLIRIIGYRHPDLQERQNEIPSILNNALYQLKKVGKTAELTKIRVASLDEQSQWLDTVGFQSIEARNIMSVLLDRQFNPASVASNIFPILAIADDLKAVIQSTGLESSKAREINKLTAEALNVKESVAERIRVQTAEQVVEEEKSLSATRELVRQLLQQHNPTSPRSDQQAEKIMRQVQNMSFEQLDQKQLKEVRAVFKERVKELDQLIKGS
jgi:ParB family transcriptional regulator, chromosome partitioning protein